MKSGRPRPPRGVSLIEMMVTMTVLTIVLGLTVALMEMLLRLNSSGRDHATTEATIARLARAFREDVRDAATAARCDDGGRSGTIDLANATSGHLVAYQTNKTGVVRVEWSGDDIVTQDRFLLPSRSAPRFTRKTTNGRVVVSLVMDRRLAKSHEHADDPSMTIEATLDASRRFSPRSEASR